MQPMLKDWRGKLYGVGSTIVYCTANGSSSAKMTEGVVVAIENAPDGSDDGYPYRVRVRVGRVSDEFAYRQRGLKGRADEKTGKVITLRRTDHITVVCE